MNRRNGMPSRPNERNAPQLDDEDIQELRTEQAPLAPVLSTQAKESRKRRKTERERQLYGRWMSFKSGFNSSSGVRSTYLLSLACFSTVGMLTPLYFRNLKQSLFPEEAYASAPDSRTAAPATASGPPAEIPSGSTSGASESGVVGFTAGLLRAIAIGVLQSLGLTDKPKTDKGPGHFCAGLQWIREITGVRGWRSKASYGDSRKLAPDYEAKGKDMRDRLAAWCAAVVLRYNIPMRCVVHSDWCDIHSQ